VYDLEVPDLLAIRLPWRGCPGEGGHDLDPGGGQPEHRAECRQVLADVGSVAGGWGWGKDRHRHAAPVDPVPLE